MPTQSYWDSARRGFESLVDDHGEIEIELVQKDELSIRLAKLPSNSQTWIELIKFKAKEGEVCVIPSPEGKIDRVLLGVSSTPDIWSFAVLPSTLPAGSYKFAAQLDDTTANAAALGWLLGKYSFQRYKRRSTGDVNGVSVLQWPTAAHRQTVISTARSYYFVRDLVTTPAEDMGPHHLAEEAAAMASSYGASFSEVVGDSLLDEGYPAIHMVGRASYREPRLIDIRWSPPSGDLELPLVVLVGKGVCFDSGGLNIKSAASMKLMKNDMGGGALMLGLAAMIMDRKLPVSLRVLVPAVENSISGNAYRPLDVVPTRAGITVENGNTDAEGRLILCDALCAAVAESPALIIDAATLTSGARIALGPELPALFCNNDEVAASLLSAAQRENDPMWRMPLVKEYRKLLDSKVADIKSYNSNVGGSGGAITAALFLQEFVAGTPRWVHIDTPAWTNSNFSQAGRPEGGEATGLRGLFRFIEHECQQGFLSAS